MNPKRLWPAAVVAVLALTVIANVFVFVAAHDQNAAVIEPDYYRKAVGFDTTLAERRASDALGWHVEATLGLPAADGMADVRVRLTGRDGAPIEDAHLRLAATHNRDAAHPVRGTLAPAGAGAYTARLPFRRHGLWELALDIERGADRFGASLRCETGATAAR